MRRPSMSKFTSDEWHVDPFTGEVQSNGTRIAKVYGATMFNREKNADECMANARLILAAPAMYEALQACLDRFADYDIYGEMSRQVKAIQREVEGDV